MGVIHVNTHNYTQGALLGHNILVLGKRNIFKQLKAVYSVFTLQAIYSVFTFQAIYSVFTLQAIYSVFTLKLN